MNVLDAPAPALLGMDFLEKSGAVVDFDKNTVVFKKVSPQTHALKKLASGHVALKIVGDGLKGAASWLAACRGNAR